MASNDDMFLVIVGDEEVPDELKDVVEESDNTIDMSSIVEEVIEESGNYEGRVKQEEVTEDTFNMDTVEIVDEGVIVEESAYEEQMPENSEQEQSQTFEDVSSQIILEEPYQVETVVMNDETANDNTNEEANDENTQQIIIEGLDESSKIVQLENGQLQIENGQHYLIQQENGEYILQEPCKYNLVQVDDQIVLQKVEATDGNEETQVNDADIQYIQVQEAENEDDAQSKKEKRPNKVNSYVQELKDTYPELNDEKKLISTLAEIMKTLEPPPLPENYCVLNGVMFECSVCGKFFNSMPEAARHYQYYHGERYLICFACGADFRNPTNLYKHEKGCTVYPDIITVLKARSKHLSSKGRSRPYFLKSHIRIENDRFVCSQCPLSFVSRAGLEAHEPAHADERPFRCSKCVCAYTSPSALSRHQRKHREEMLVCERCGRRLHDRAAFDTHQAMHAANHIQEKRFECRLCTKRFSSKASLEGHMERLHSPQPCVCQLCPRRFHKMTQLKSHMKKDHGMLLMTKKMFYKSLPSLTPAQVENAKVILKSEVEAPSYQIEIVDESET